MAVLVTVLLGSASALAACADPDEVVRGALVLPTTSDAAPAAVAQGARVGGIALVAYLIDGSDLVPGAPYSLEAAGQTSVFCLPNPSQPCVPGEVRLPDFNIQFYDGNGIAVGTTGNKIGNDAGTVPTTAQQAVVWMRYGPDLTLLDGTASDGRAEGADFVLKMGGGCSLA